MATESEILQKQLQSLEYKNQELQQKLAEIENNQRLNPDGAQALQLAELIIDNSSAVLFRRLASDDPKLRKMIYVSPNISRFGYQAEDFLNEKIMFRDIVFPEDSKRTLEEIKYYVDNNIDTYTQTYRIITRSGEVRWIEDRTSIVDDPTMGVRFHQGIVIDIHKRKEAEEQLRKSEEKYRRIVETAGEGFLLMDRDLKIVDLNSTFAEMANQARDQLISKSSLEIIGYEFRELWAANLEETNRKYHKFECAIQSGKNQTIPVLVHSNTLQSDTGDIIGKMVFVTDITQQKKALSLAGEVQRSLLPKNAPPMIGLDVAGKNIQCDEVGGDYFDYLWNGKTEDSEFSVVIGDITGHGVDSALLMSSARAFLRMRASQPGTLVNIITAMNEHLTEDVYATGRFMTLFYLTMDKERNSVEWVRAGHDPAFLYDPETKNFEYLKGPGLALGVDRDYIYQLQRRDDLKTGHIIVAGTDGIWEGCNRQGEMFGKTRFEDIIRKNSASDAQTILSTIFKEHALFSKGVKPEDDITLVIVKIT